MLYNVGSEACILNHGHPILDSDGWLWPTILTAVQLLGALLDASIRRDLAPVNFFGHCLSAYSRNSPKVIPLEDFDLVGRS